MMILSRILGSQSRVEILKRLFVADAPAYYLRKLAREANLSAPVIHRELRNLQELDLIELHSDGNRINFAANRNHKLYPVLCELVRMADDGEKKCKNIE